MPGNEMIALYIRLSVEDGDLDDGRKKESNSILHQRMLLHEFVQSRVELKNCPVQEFCDDGYSGTNFHRPGFQEMMRMVKLKKIGCIIVKEDCVIIELNQKALENRDFVMWFCFFDPKTDTFYTLLAQGGGARRVERPQQHS